MTPTTWCSTASTFLLRTEQGRVGVCVAGGGQEVLAGSQTWRCPLELGQGRGMLLREQVFMEMQVTFLNRSHPIISPEKR